MNTGIELIIKKRESQLAKGYTPEEDLLTNNSCQLLNAIHVMVFYQNIDKDSESNILSKIPANWDKQVWLKMCRKPYTERLAIAGALIAAEIDRIQQQ